MSKELEAMEMATIMEMGMKSFYKQTIDMSLYEMIDKNVFGEMKEALNIKETDNKDKSLSALAVIYMMILSKLNLKELSKKDMEEIINTTNFINKKLKEIKEKYY